MFEYLLLKIFTVGDFKKFTYRSQNIINYDWGIWWKAEPVYQ